MTLLEALAILHAACEDERETLADALWPVLLGDRTRLTSAIMAAWPDAADEICAVIAEYQEDRARIDAEIAVDNMEPNPTGEKMNRQSADKPETSFEDFAEFPSPYFRAMLMRFRIELFSAAKALQGDLLAEFWKVIDDVNALRPKEKKID